MPPAVVRVFVVTNIPLLVGSLKDKKITEDLTIEIVGDARTRALDEQLEEIEADVLLLDGELRNNNGLDVLIKVRNAKPEIKIILMTLYQDFDIAEKAIKEGAQGVISKEAEVFDIIWVIKKVYQGGIAIFLTEDIWDICSEMRRFLSERGMAVYCRMVRGFNTNEICESLLLGDKLVEKEKTNIYEKLKTIPEFRGLESRGIGRKLGRKVSNCNRCNGLPWDD